MYVVLYSGAIQTAGQWHKIGSYVCSTVARFHRLWCLCLVYSIYSASNISVVLTVVKRWMVSGTQCRRRLRSSSAWPRFSSPESSWGRSGWLELRALYDPVQTVLRLFKQRRELYPFKPAHKYNTFSALPMCIALYWPSARTQCDYFKAQMFFFVALCNWKLFIHSFIVVLNLLFVEQNTHPWPILGLP
jgi:hypothetical protein